MDHHAGLLDGPVGREILALEIGVDRHLQGAASGDGWDEVDRDDAALAAGKVDRLVGEGDLHVYDASPVTAGNLNDRRCVTAP